MNISTAYCIYHHIVMNDFNSSAGVTTRARLFSVKCFWDFVINQAFEYNWFSKLICKNRLADRCHLYYNRYFLFCGLCFSNLCFTLEWRVYICKTWSFKCWIQTLANTDLQWCVYAEILTNLFVLEPLPFNKGFGCKCL